MAMGLKLILFAWVAMMRSLEPCKKAATVFHPSRLKSTGKPPASTCTFLTLGARRKCHGRTQDRTKKSKRKILRGQKKTQ